jgi:peptide/nickel transport system substrate-binding protein
VALAGAAAACDREAPPAASGAPRALRVGVAQPGAASSAEAAVSQVAKLLTYAALVRTDPDGTIQAGLASSWSSSPDGRTWRFRLRPGLSFDDGSPLDAEAVASVLEAARRNPLPAPGLRDIAGVRVESHLDLVVEQHVPSSLLLESLSMFWIEGGRSGTGTAGPYRVETSTGERTVLRAFGAYYGGPPHIERVELVGYPSPRAAWVALMRDEIDLLYDVPAEATEFVEASTDIQTFSFLRAYVHLLGFNVAHPALRDQRVRRALALAVDREELIAQAFAGRAVAASDGVWARHWARDEHRAAPRRDVPAAKRLLAEALRPKGAPPAASQPVMELSCLLPAGYPSFERSALVLQRQLLDVGVDLRPEVLPVAELTARLVSGRFETYLLEQVAGWGLGWTYWFWHSPGESIPWIQSGYEGADAALDGIRRAQDRHAVGAAVRDLQDRFLEDPPAVFLVWTEASRAVRRRFLVPDDTEGDILASLPDWRVRPEGTPE